MSKPESRKVTRLLILMTGAVAGAVTACSGAATDDNEAEEANASQLITCSTSKFQAPDGEPATWLERYNLTLLNAEDAATKDLRRGLGLSRIESCADARAFMALKNARAEAVLPVRAARAPSDLKPPAKGSGEDEDAAVPKVWGGTVAEGAWGVVRIRLAEDDPNTFGCDPDEGHPCPACSGVIINDRAIITSAHCLTGLTSSNHSSDWFRIHYLARGSKTDMRLITSGWEYLEFFIHESYAGDGDTEDDIGIIVRPGGWLNTNDYGFLYKGSFDHWATGTVYGYGAKSYNTDEGSGTLRSGAIEIDWFGAKHFLDDNDEQRVCKGDSGGPMYLVKNNSWMVAGLTSNADMRDPSEFCAPHGMKQRWTRMDDHHINWIESKLGIDCVNGSTVTEGKTFPFASCGP